MWDACNTWFLKVLLRSKFNVKFVTKTLSFQLIRSGCTGFVDWNELWRPLSENIELENVDFLASAITNLCSSEPTVLSCGLIIQSDCSLTCDVIFWTRREKQTWTVRKQRAILKASLFFARFWYCKGGNHRLRWLCRTSTHWIWDSQILRAASLREGRNAHFTKSYFMQFVPREIRTTGRCTYLYVLAIIINHRQDDRESAPILPAF